MKILILSLALLSPIFLSAQKRESKPTDSVKFYQQELHKLWKNMYDSFRKSEKYNELAGNLKRLRKHPGNYSGMVLFGDVIHSDYENFNESIVESGFTPLKPDLFRFGFGISNKAGRAMIDFYMFIVGYNNDSKKDNETIKTSLANMLQVDVGYDLTKSNFISIYPFAGLSLRLSNLNYMKPAVTNPNYTNITNIVVNNQTAYSTSFRVGYQAGIGIDLNLSPAKENRASTIFFTKFGINRPFTADTYNVHGINYKPGIQQGQWVLAFGFKFVSKG